MHSFSWNGVPTRPSHLLLPENDFLSPALGRPGVSPHSLGPGLSSCSLSPFPSPPALETLAGPSSEPALPHRCGNCQMLWWFKCAVEARIKGWCPQLMLSKAAGECYRCGCRWIGGGRPRALHLSLNRCLTLYFPGGQKEPDYSASVGAMRDRTSSPALARGGSQALGFHPSAHKTGSYSQNFSVGDFIPTLNFNGQASKGIVVSTPGFVKNCLVACGGADKVTRTGGHWSFQPGTLTMFHQPSCHVKHEKMKLPHQVICLPSIGPIFRDPLPSLGMTGTINSQPQNHGAKQAAVLWKADAQQAYKHLLARRRFTSEISMQSG